MNQLWPVILAAILEHLPWILGTAGAAAVSFALVRWWPRVATERQKQIAGAARGASLMLGSVAPHTATRWDDQLAEGLRLLAEGLERQGAPPLQPAEAKVAAQQLITVGVVPPVPLSAAAQAARERLLRTRT